MEQIACLFREGGMQPLVDMLGRQDSKITGVILDALQNILRAADSLNQKEALCEVLEEYGLVDHLERLQMHNNVEVGCLADQQMTQHAVVNIRCTSYYICHKFWQTANGQRQMLWEACASLRRTTND